jgi:hypothetical protein
MSKETGEQINKVKNFGQFLNEHAKQTPPNEPKKLLIISN